MLVGCESESISVLGKRNEAKAALLKLAVNQERFYQSNETYSDDLTQLDFATDPFVTDSGSYTIDIAPGADASNYSATATYNVADAEAHECLSFEIDGRGSGASCSDNP